MEVHVVKVPKVVGKVLLAVAMLFDRSPKRPKAKKIEASEEKPAMDESFDEDLFPEEDVAAYASEEEAEEEEEEDKKIEA